MFWQRRVHRDGHMALALVEKPLQFSLDTHTAHCDALRTPGIAIVGSQYLRGSQHIVEVIHRLSLTHKHDMRQCFALRQGVDLIQDVTSRKTTLEALLTRLTKQTVHLTAHLGGDTERGTITVGDIHRLHEFRAITNRKEILDRSILRMLAINRFHSTDDISLSQPLTIHLRDVRHLFDALHVLLIEPLGDLSCRELGHTQILHDSLQPVKRHPEQYSFFAVHDSYLATKVQKK